ncbi:tRNA preQ1(34) S-adenosylmethionine ribosyltransferase-isomerase QueA [candidate division GN15 bacterium]|uniref:S-adenosylmethionine:tRNA ribosyltransferase-isomerase n=1 Tax=candidate division GN15 bacterium TaxID=2072418 RepID=A0A855X192_9BACT|nr:MAG: tRNA preQ1(34) S-adenosylmethionine ribosyltransferase-isomerase QueA [candidate division GN15 bacterium]
MNLSLFDYHLPKELIAQSPARLRSASRLMVLDRANNSIRHTRFRHVVEYLRRGDALVVNNTKVFKARLWGHRKSGGKVEVFLIRKSTESELEQWEAFVSPSRRLHEDELIYFDDQASVRLVCHMGNGRWLIQFGSPTSCHKILAHFGHVPLPHYINRDDTREDIRRYQTLFADRLRVGAVAAPTAGFHFTRSLLHEIDGIGVKVVPLTLHVGPGTFKPVKTESIEDHVVDAEFAELTEKAASTINSVRRAGGRIFVVGTTSVRTLESAPVKATEIQPFSGMVDLFIKPGFAFNWTEHLITNFHLPKSSLLILVSAFAGRERIVSAYQAAIAERYRFYSYGDATLIL